MEEEKQEPRRARRVTIRHIATGLLLAAVAIYVAARFYEPVHPLIGYLRAFAEAAMVGALADWFAVTALFRHPLGVPIPHTAVVQRNKDRVGDALGRFVEQHFLTHEELEARIAGIDFAALLARWLAEPGNRAEVAGQLTPLLPRVLDAVDDEAVNRFAQAQLREHFMRRVEVVPLVAGVLEMLTAQNRHQGFIDALLKQAVALLEESEPEIRERVRAATSWIWRRFAIDKRVTHQIMTAAEQKLAQVGSDPAHAWREGVDRAVREFIEKLRTSDEFREEGERLKARLLDDPALAGVVAGLWGEIARAVREDSRDPASGIRAGLDAGLALAAQSLADHPDLQRSVNVWLHKLILEVILARRHEVARLISDTVRAWDADTVAQRIEQAVGDDLQYIRINGTVIGGLAGVTIHAVSQLVF
jgi:uncharacterized membrane-anchored protein YjiN (DUF445 family)